MRIPRTVSFAENQAMEAWRKRHPGRPWPLAFDGVEPDRGFDYSSYAAPADRNGPTVAEVAEAETMVKAVEAGRFPDAVPSSSPDVQRRADVLTAAFGPRVFADWRADWSQLRNQAALKAQTAPPEAEVLSAAESLLQSGKAPVPSRDPIADLLATPTGKSVGGGGGTDGLRLPNFGLMNDMVSAYKEYLGVLPPQIVLQNLIGLRNGFVREKADPKLIKDLNAAIGKLAMDYKHHWDET